MKWTDELVMKFSRICTEGPYGEYEGCKTMEAKLEKFKQLHSGIDKEYVLTITGGDFPQWYGGLTENERREYNKVFNKMQQDYDKNKSLG